MQTTKPTFPVKDKNSADPAIKKWRDQDANQLLEAFEKADENFTDLDERMEKVGEVPEYLRSSLPIRIAGDTEGDEALKKSEVPTYDQGQFEQIGGIAYIKSIFSQSNLFAVDLKRSFAHGSPQSPIYWRLTINLNNAVVGNTVVVHHCWIENPDVFVNGWATPTASYADQAAMIAAQGSQSVGPVYKVGATEYWRWLGTTDGDIGDYAAVPHIVFTGDAYLTGVDNLNILTMRFVSLHEVSGHLIPDCLVVTNESFTNGNLDPAKPQLALAVHLLFNENKNLVSDSTLVNSASLYASETSVYVTNPSEFTYNDLGGGNYSLQNSNQVTTALRGGKFILMSSTLKRLMEQRNKITVVARIRRRSTSSDTGNLTIAGNFDSVSSKGWQFVITNVSTNPRYTFRAGSGVRNAGSTPLTCAVNGNDNWFWCMCIWDGIQVRFFQKSTPRSIAFEEMSYISAGTLSGQNVSDGLDIIRLQGENTTSAPDRQRDDDQMYIFFDALTPEQGEALMID